MNMAQDIFCLLSFSLVDCSHRQKLYFSRRKKLLFHIHMQLFPQRNLLLYYLLGELLRCHDYVFFSLSHKVVPFQNKKKHFDVREQEPRKDKSSHFVDVIVQPVVLNTTATGWRRIVLAVHWELCEA